MTIEQVHAENLSLIANNDIEVGDLFISKETGEHFILTTIHDLYGWLLFNNKDTNVPQRVSKALSQYSHYKRAK